MKNRDYNVGDIVEVISDCQTLGCIGKVITKNFITQTVTVNIKGVGLRTYGHSSVRYIGDITDDIKGGNIMLNGKYRVALVNFISGTNTTKDYAFALYDDNVQVNDLVLVDASSTFSVAKVKAILEKDEYSGVAITKEIVCKIDIADYENRKKLRQEKKALQSKMDKLVKENQVLIVYQAIADKNPEMAELLKQYQALDEV